MSQRRHFPEEQWGGCVATETEVRDSLHQVIVPAAKRDIVGLNLVRDVSIGDGAVTVTLAKAALSGDVQERLTLWIRAAVEKLPGVREVTIDFVDASPRDLNRIDQVIAVMSGKGGVGKSLVSGLLAVSLRRRGHAVGILDADITGASIPHMFGITARPMGSDTGILPVMSAGGIEVMSMNLLLPETGSAVIWRGPLLTRAIGQFWGDVLWGNLDYLVVDLPPGTADAPLSALQTLPVSGVVIVTTPQDLTTMIVRKAVDMARKMDKTIIGLVENMSYLYVEEIDRKIELFGASKAEAVAESIGAPFLGRLPIDPDLARHCDRGEIESYHADSADRLGDAIVAAITSRATAARAATGGGREQ